MFYAITVSMDIYKFNKISICWMLLIQLNVMKQSYRYFFIALVSHLAFVCMNAERDQ